MAAGFLGAALLGAGGVAAGVAAGHAFETSVAVGLPKDELFLYEDAPTGSRGSAAPGWRSCTSIILRGVKARDYQWMRS